MAPALRCGRSDFRRRKFTAQGDARATGGTRLDLEVQRRAFDELACLNARPQRLADAVDVALAAVDPLRHHGYQPSGRAVWVGSPGWGPRALRRGLVEVRAVAPSPQALSLRTLPAAGADARETCERRVRVIDLLRGGARGGGGACRRRRCIGFAGPPRDIRARHFGPSVLHELKV